MKKLLLKLGSVTAAAIPVATAVSCGVEIPTKEATENYLLIKSNKVMHKLELAWQEQVIKKEFPAFDKDNALAIPFIKEVYEDWLHRKLMKDSHYLENLSSQIIIDENFGSGLNSEAKKARLANWGIFKYRANGDFEVETLTTVDDAVTKGNGLSNWAIEFIFKNIPNVREAVYKNVIASQYIKDANMAAYKARMLTPGARLSSTQDLIDPDNFLLIDQLIKLRLFTKWEIKLDDTNNDLFKWIGNSALTLANKAAIYGQFTDAAGKLGADANYKAKQSKITSHDIYYNASDTGTWVGYAGIYSQASGQGNLSFTLDSMKAITSSDGWYGTVLTKDGKTEIKDKVESWDELFGKDHKALTLSYVKGLMPIFTAGAFKLDTYLATQKDKLIFEIVSRKSMYDDAIKFYTSDDTTNTDRNDYLLDIKSPQLRAEAINHGFKFIK